MDKALVFGTKDCRLESCQDHVINFLLYRPMLRRSVASQALVEVVFVPIERHVGANALWQNSGAEGAPGLEIASHGSCGIKFL